MKLHLTDNHVVAIRLISVVFLVGAALDAYGTHVFLAAAWCMAAIGLVTLHAEWKDSRK